MLGSVVYQVLAGYLGHYVKDMQREQFRIGLWSGEVLLENMDLRLEAFDYLQLPFSIKQASVGKLRIIVPWKKLGWEPILISLEDVTICAGPRDESEWDAEASERRELAAKKAALASAEIAKFSKCVSETKSGQSFLSNFFGKIVDNVQVIVSKVHIQYMDKKTDPEVMFLVGLTLSGLTVSTSDASFAGSSGGGKVRGSQEHKVVEVKQLALYWNPHSHPLGAHLNAMDNPIVNVLRREEDTPDKVVYLLRPTDVTLKLLINKNESAEDGGAQYAIVVNMDDLSLALEDQQLRGMLLLFSAISISRAREKYGRFRPQAEGEGKEQRGWQKRLWHYAIEAVLSDVRKRLWRHSLSYIVWRKEHRERYVALYVNKLENLQHGQPSGHVESAELEELEKQFEMDEILFFRSLAEKKMPLEDVFANAAALDTETSDGLEAPTEGDLLTPEPILQQRGWLNWLSLGLLGASDSPDSGQIFPQEIIKDLYEAAKLYPMPLMDSGELSKGSCHVAVTLHIGELLGSLHSSKLGRDILNISVQGIGVTVQMWSEMTNVSVMVRTLEAVDLCTPGNCFPRILAPWGKLTQRKPAQRSYAEALAGAGLVRSGSDGSVSSLQAKIVPDEEGLMGELTEPLLRVEIEFQPMKEDHDLAVTVVLQPVEFVYSPTFIERASSFFSFPASQDVLNEQVDAALRKLEDAALTEFQHKVVERKRLHLLLDIRRPNFLFPESNMTSSGILMILAVDSIYFASPGLSQALEDLPTKGRARSATLRRHIGGRHGIYLNKLGQIGCNLENTDIPPENVGHYDRFELRLTGAQILISGKSGDWHETLNSHEADLEWHLIKRFNLHVVIDISIKEDPLLPRLKIHGSLPALRLHLSIGKCRAIRGLLAKLFNSSNKSKNTSEAAVMRRPRHVEGGTGLFALELNVKLKVVTVELCLDGEHRAASLQLEKKTLVAQMHDASLKYAQHASHEELQLLIKTIHFEDASELASSPFRYLLYCSGCHGSSSLSSLAAETKNCTSKPTEIPGGTYSACFNVVLGGAKGFPEVGILAALHGLELHVNPKVVRSLHGFVLAATAPKVKASDGNHRRLMTINDSHSVIPVTQENLTENYMDNEDSNFCSIFSGLPIKSPVHTQMQATVLSPSCPGWIKGAKIQRAGQLDGKEKETPHFRFQNISRQLLPLCGIFEEQVAQQNSTILDVHLVLCAVQFFDLGGNVGIVILPEATMCTSVPSVTSSEEESWEVVAALSDLQVKGTHWASGNVNGDPVGSLTSGPLATWDVRVSKASNGNVDVLIQVQKAQVLLFADYLAGLIEYFNSSHWISERSSNNKQSRKSSCIFWKVEVEDSILFLPREQGKKEFLQLVLGKLLFTSIEDGSCTDSFYIVGQKVSVQMHGAENNGGDAREVKFRIPSGGRTLVERWDGEMSIEVPPGDLPTCLEIHSSILDLILDGNSFRKQAEAFESLSRDLSAIERRSKSMTSSILHGGLNSWIPGKHAYESKTSLSRGSVSLKFCALKLCITVAVCDTGEILLPRSVATLQMDSLDIELSVNRGELEELAVNVNSIVLLQYATQLKLLQCKGGEELDLVSCPALKLLISAEGLESEVHISLPSTQVWLHFSAWSEVAPLLAAILKPRLTSAVMNDFISHDMSRQHDSLPISLSKSLQKPELLVLQDADVGYSSPQRQEPQSGIVMSSFSVQSGSEIPLSKSLQANSATVLVKVGTFRLCFIMLDCSGEAHKIREVDEFGRASVPEKPVPGKLLSCTLALRVDEFRVNKDGTWSLAAGITQGEGNALENFEDHDPFRELWFQATEISVVVDGSSQQSPSMKFEMRVHAECINTWCSNPILRFFHKFTFEELESGPSPTLDIEGKVKISLQQASFLLSDGRWNCNAPILELMLENIVIEMNWWQHKLEACLSSEVGASYHNMQKVSWEPLVEPWNVRCVLTDTQDVSSILDTRKCTRVRVSSTTKLNINITESLVQAASRAAEMTQDAWADDSPERDLSQIGGSSQYAPYWLQNDTGVALTYWLVGASNNHESTDNMDGGWYGWGSGSGIVVQPGGLVALYLEGSPEEILCRQRNSETFRRVGTGKMFESPLQHRMICVQLEGTSRPSPPMSIDLVGSRSFEASFSESESGDIDNPSSNNVQGVLHRQNSSHALEADNRDRDIFRTPVVFEVTIQKYSKLVRLCSTVEVVNMISVPLELRFDIPFMISPKVMDPVLPGQVIPLPVHLAQTGKMRWRPLGSNFLWSEAQSLRLLLQVPDSQLGLHRPVLCYPSHRTNRPFRCCLSVSYSPIAAVDSSFGELTQNPLERGRVSMDRPKEFKLWNITLQAPLIVKNCLPLPSVITIDSGVGAIVSHRAPEGTAVQHHEHQDQPPKYLKMPAVPLCSSLRKLLGNSMFVYDVDTVHNLNVTFQVPGFVTSRAIVVYSAHLLAEPSRQSDREGRVRTFDNLTLFAESILDPSVAVEVEIVVDTISGTREFCISVPFWIYNCTYLNLAVMDGDVDVLSGRQTILGKSALEDAGSKQIQSDMVFEATLRPGLAGLATGEGQTMGKSYGRFLKRGLHIISNSPCLTTAPCHYKLSCDGPDEQLHVQNRKLDECEGKLIPHIFSPVKGTEASEHRLRVRIMQPVHMETCRSVEQLWSSPFPLNLADGTTRVTIPQAHSQGAYVFSVICTTVLGIGAGKTKTITFRPRYLLSNSCKRDLCVKQQGTDTFERLPVGQHCYLHWTDVNRDLLVSVRFSDHGWDWSGGFAPDQLGDTQVKVRNHSSGAMQMLRVEVSTMTSSSRSMNKDVDSGGESLGTCLILLSDDETGFMPYRIDNFSMERIRFHQQKCEKMENILHPYSSCSYAWDEPCDPHRLVVEIPGGGALGVYGLDEVKEYPAIVLPSTLQKPERTFSVSVRAEGPIRVLSIVDTEIHTMKSPFESCSVDPSSQQFEVTSSRILVPDTESLKELLLDLSYIGLSLIDSTPQEIVFACAKGVSLQIVQGQHLQQLKVRVAVLQIDNQLRHAVYPVLLSITNPEIDTTHDGAWIGAEQIGEPALTLLVAKWRRPAGSVDCFQCINLRLVPLRLEVEEQVVLCLLQFMDKTTESFSAGMKVDKLGPSKEPFWSFLRWNHINRSEQYAATALTFEVVQLPASQSKGIRFNKVVRRLEGYQCWAAAAALESVGGPQQKLPLLAKERPKAYIEILHINAIELTVSFSSTPWLANQSGAATRSLLLMTGKLLQHHVMAIADAEDALMHLRQLTLAHPLASWDVIRGMITRHYTRQLLQEVYKVLGSADVLGNPIHFIRTLSSGMWDFVSTPARSFKQSPMELARGLMEGTQSLFSNTVFAFSNAATRISKAAHKGVTAFALDKDYVEKRERREHSHGQEDLSVVNEFLEGLTGLLQSPVRGAEKAGLPGMLSGAAVGALGVVARPVASILEVASKTGQSIVNRSSPTQWRATRMRLPRHLSQDSPLLPYSWESAVGRAVLLEADGGCLRTEVLVLCMPLVHGEEFVLLTQTRILRVSSTKINYLSGFKWNMELVAAIEDILHIDHVDNRVSILLGPARREFIRSHQFLGLGHKAMCLPTHETLFLSNPCAADQFLSILHILKGQMQHKRTTLLVSTWTT